MVTKFTYLAVAISVLTACSLPDKQKEELVFTTDSARKKLEINWIEGEFEYVSNQGIYREYWRKNNNEEYIGKGYFLSKGDTSFLMRMKLYNEGGIVKMDYNVNSQNEGKSIRFSLSKVQDNTYVFENPFKEFPSIMQYKFSGDTMISITEKGFVNETEKTEAFQVNRIHSY